MTVVVFLEQSSIPKTKTGIYKTIFQLLTRRAALKSVDQAPVLEDLLDTLGEFAWNALQKDVQQLLLKKVCIQLK